MSRTPKIKAQLLSEFNKLPMNWYAIYKWVPSSKKYLDDVSDIICEYYTEIQVDYDGLRKRGFRCISHDGSCRLNTSITQVTEKRICRALFNHKELGVLGTAIDYEVPFKEFQTSKQGDIDLLSYDSARVYIIEAKSPDSTESLLKAILQAYSYSSLVRRVQQEFCREYPFNKDQILTPTVLVFDESECGNVLRSLWKYPGFTRLIHIINESCVSSGVGELRFYRIMNDTEEIKNFLIAEPPEATCPKILFRTGFFPNIQEVIYEH